MNGTLPTGEWIKCTDRLPEAGKPVLVAAGGEVLIGQRYGSGPTGEGWYAATNFNDPRNSVSHWMPLPPLPIKPIPSGNKKDP